MDFITHNTVQAVMLLSSTDPPISFQNSDLKSICYPPLFHIRPNRPSNVMNVTLSQTVRQIAETTARHNAKLCTSLE
jgi:hypothetical protein